MKKYRKRVKNVNGKDCLSDLHDDLLIHILSFLDVKSAAKTCVLSRRWNNKLWIHHQDVYFNTKKFGKTSYNFEKFVDMVLTQRDKLHHKIRSFTFTWKFKSRIPQELLDKVHAHVHYHDVQHFDLSIPPSRNRYYPFQEFNPKSLTTLRLNLSNRYPGRLCNDFDLELLQRYLSGCTTLKTLWLEKIWMMKRGGGVVDLFSSLVDLKELHIIGCVVIQPFRIRAPRLERLTLIENTAGLPWNIRAPRLERLTLLENTALLENRLEYRLHWNSSLRVLKYLRTDFQISAPTTTRLPRYIEELEIDFLSSTNYRTADHAKWLINQIRCLPHAKSVTLSKSTLQVISAYLSRSRVPVTLPQFKWKLLKVITTNELPTQEFPEYLRGLAYLRKNCSKTLKVEFVRLSSSKRTKKP